MPGLFAKPGVHSPPASVRVPPDTAVSSRLGGVDAQPPTPPDDGAVRLERRTLHHGGRDRPLLVARPASPVAGGPLLLVLHGSNGTGATVRRAAGRDFDTLARDAGATVVYPTGFRRHWNDARARLPFAARREEVDDVGFLRAIVAASVRADDVDHNRVVAAGFSNGGAMVNRLAHEAPELLASAVMIGATQPAPGNVIPLPPPGGAVPLLLVHGTRDATVPYDGGESSVFGLNSRGPGLSAPQTLLYWAARNGLDAARSVAEVVARDEAGATTAERLTVDDEVGRVALYSVIGGGHTIPSSAHPVGGGFTVVGAMTADLVALRG